MGLLDDGIYWVAGALAVVAVAGGAWLTAITPRKVWGGLINALVLLVASTLMVVSVALVLNRQNGWFAEPGDIWGQERRSHVTIHGADPATRQSDPVSRTDHRELPLLPAPGQREQTVSIPTSVGDQSWEVTILLPENYFDDAHATDAYPVLLAAHGIPGSMSQWTDALDLRKHGDPLVEQGAVRPFIAVVPQITPMGEDTECVYGPDGPEHCRPG